MFASYRRLFTTPGTLAFTLAGLLARLSYAMTGVSTVVLIAGLRGSYALAGAVSAAGMAAVAVGMPLLGRLVDRYGQARVTVPVTLLTAVPLAALLLCVRYGAPGWTLFLCWPLAAVSPNLGGMARARWAHLHRYDPAAQHLAAAFEQALDELCFTAGPVLAMLACTTLFPAAGLLLAGLSGGLGALLFAAQRRTEPPVGGPAMSGRNAPLRSPGLRVLLLTFLATGVVFGSLEVTTVAYTDTLGQRPAAGGLLALLAAGSGFSGLLLGPRRPRRSPAARLLTGLGLMTALLLLPLAAARAGAGLPWLALALFAAGSGTAPTMISGMTLVQQLVPAGRLNEAMSVAVSGILIGIAAGSALGGSAAQQSAPGTGFAIPAAAAGLALLTAATGFRWLARQQPVNARTA